MALASLERDAVLSYEFEAAAGREPAPQVCAEEPVRGQNRHVINKKKDISEMQNIAPRN
jgi:hypothetical protein